MRDSLDAAGGRASAAKVSTPQEQAKRRSSNAARSSRQMNASAGSFKEKQQSCKDVRMAAEADLDTLSQSAKGKKKNLPKTLKPLPESKPATGLESSQSTNSITKSSNAIGQQVYTLAIGNVK